MEEFGVIDIATVVLRVLGPILASWIVVSAPGRRRPKRGPDRPWWDESATMLYEFLASNRDEILARSRLRLGARRIPTAAEVDPSRGLPLFLDQLISILRAGKGGSLAAHQRVADS